jgi:hypothetical protein
VTVCSESVDKDLASNLGRMLVRKSAESINSVLIVVQRAGLLWWLDISAESAGTINSVLLVVQRELDCYGGRILVPRVQEL